MHFDWSNASALFDIGKAAEVEMYINEGWIRNAFMITFAEHEVYGVDSGCIDFLFVYCDYIRFVWSLDGVIYPINAYLLM